MSKPRQVPKPPLQILDESKDPRKQEAADRTDHEKRLKDRREHV